MGLFPPGYPLRTLTNKLKEQDCTIGVYPLLPEETCWFVTADFDKADWLLDRRLRLPPLMPVGRGFSMEADYERARMTLSNFDANRLI
jgi:hypothetical protein